MLRPQLLFDLVQLSAPPVGDHDSPFTTALRDFLNMSGFKSSVIFALLAGLVAWQRPRIMGWWHSWNSDAIHLWNVVPLGTPKRRRAVALLEAINRGAVDRAAEYSGQSLPGQTVPARNLGERLGRATKALRPAKFSPRKATTIWKPFSDEFWEPQRAYITQGCHAFTGSEDFWADDAESVVRGWLESSSAESNSGKIWISAAGGAGKTAFIHRLFLDLIGGIESHSPLRAPVPMLASANNLKPYTEQIAALKTGDDACTVFADVWLKNRGIEVPEYLRKSLLASFSEGLKKGDILLLFDGYDELAYMDLGTWPIRLIEQVRRCVVAQRADHTAAATQKDRSVSLEDAWNSTQIAEHLTLRWPDSPEERAIVTSVITGVIERYDEIERDHRHRASHWLSQPRNLDLFLKDLVPEDQRDSKGLRGKPKLPDERELRRRAESQPYLFDRIVGRAIARVADQSAKEGEIRHRLFSIAVNDPTDPRRRMISRPVELGDVTGQHVSALSELLGLSEGEPGVSPDRLYFRHAALREYFIAGRIAWEIHETARATDPGDELVRFESDAWDSTKRQAIAEWLNRLDRHHDSVTAREHRVALVTDRLPRRGQAASPTHPNMLRNLVELMIGLELGPQAGHSPGGAGRQRSDIELRDLDLSTLAGDHIDLKSMTVNNCSFDKAQLVAAQLTHARFTGCSFRGANLSRADALGARFDDCDFGTAGDNPATVEQMVIDEKAFPPDVSLELLKRGASKERSRYVNEFGEQFSKKQPAFLGGGLEQLETGAYLPAIEQAVRDWEQTAPGQPVYLVDLMAGGSYERVTALLDKFDNLRILGIDRDPSKRPTTPRFEWRCVDIGRRGLDGTIELGVDLGSNLEDAFPASNRKAHVVVAKKALHELDYELQPDLIREVAASLMPGGRFILFADTPGSADGAVDLEKLRGVHADLDSLRDKLSDGSTLLRPGRNAPASPAQPSEVATLLAERDFDATPLGQIRFSNTWIMVKDWANQNRHERDHRYFASVPEILDWARPWFGGPVSVEVNKYRLNPLMFNEQGIQRVLKYLNAQVREGYDKKRAVLDNRAQLLEWISEGESFRVLVDFTKRKLRKDSPLAVALNAQPEEVALDKLDAALAPLNSGEKAPAFDLTCAVLVFEKR
jgi:hypothetical protein